ncbi:AraC family transcriptional regulator [Pseudomonas citronellolis]|uniref:AraC family transcriptional regulator n=1 Tax=Pseudomonas citronellolis TaxID=53408 RepID=UPI0023E3FDBD|nr:helix-turn-helix transcriptional regulator [Pseudomonas citronellolis]MDF3931475.1 helix-turn-helix transcriptional regulator [Pseudomonas citronellolis]
MRETGIPFLHGDEHAASPVAAVALDYPDGHQVASHSHQRAQLLYAVRGVLVVGSAGGIWVVPDNRGLWIPAGVEHWTRMVGDVRVRTLYIEPGSAPHLPGECAVLAVSPLLRELILAAVGIAGEVPADSRDGRVLRLLLDELTSEPALPLHLPLPNEPRLRRLSRDMGLDAGLEAWAARAGVDAKTVRRWFLRDTGLTFGQWRQQARLLRALELLGSGASVLEAALEVGYATPSAFSAMFSRQFGRPPSDFLRGARETSGNRPRSSGN